MARSPSVKFASTMPLHDDDDDKPDAVPLIVTLNCIEDCALEQDSLAGVAVVEHVGLNRLADGRIESASAVLLHSLAFLPRAAQRRLRPWQLILCLGSVDRSVDSALAADLGLRILHVDVSRSEEIADTVMALVLGLLRRTHLLSRQSLSSSGWLGSVQPLCRGMRRCRGLVLGIIGRSASARSLATRSLAFKMNVLYFDVYQVWTIGLVQNLVFSVASGDMHFSELYPCIAGCWNSAIRYMLSCWLFVGKGEGKPGFHNISSAARRMETLNDLLAASDVISLHCSLTDETVQIINDECLQHLKPGAYLVNTGSSQLLDDCAVKQLLIDGALAGCAFDGAEGPQWMEAWVREMPNVLLLPRSADYSEEAWIEIREKAISILQSYFFEGVVPSNAVSDDEEGEVGYEDEQSDKLDPESMLQMSVVQQPADDSVNPDSSRRIGSREVEYLAHEDSGLSVSSQVELEAKHSRSSKKAKKRHGRQKSHNKSEDITERDSSSQLEDDTAMSGVDQVPSPGSFGATFEDMKNRKTSSESVQGSTSNQLQTSGKSVIRKPVESLDDGCVIALRTRDHSAMHISRQRAKGGGWFLDTIPNVTARDPAAQFLVVLRDKDTIGLRSFAAGGKLLQINRRMEFVFASHSFDVWESWTLEGPLDDCRLLNCRNPTVTLDVKIEILAVVGQYDGITRWLA